MRKIEYFAVRPPLQNKFMSLARRLARARSWIARGEAERDRIRRDYYALLDEHIGPDVQVMFECRKPMEFWRLSRIMQEPREFDVEGLRAALPPEQFAAITTTVVDTKALDVARRRRMIDSRVVERYTTYGRRPSLTLEPTGPRSEIKLQPGQVAVVTPEHLALQEA